MVSKNINRSNKTIYIFWNWKKKKNYDFFLKNTKKQRMNEEEGLQQENKQQNKQNKLLKAP